MVDLRLDYYTYKVVRFLHQVWIYIRNMMVWSFPVTTKYESKWTMFDCAGISTDVQSPTFTENDTIAIETVTRTRPDGRQDERCAIRYRDKEREHYSPEDLFRHCPPPWFVIYCDDLDMTDELAPFVCQGNNITKEFLNTIVLNKDWTYMHPQTFEETNFPSEGIVIKHA